MHTDLEQLLEEGRIKKAQADLLDQWKPGTFVCHRSWGAGKIESWDLSQGKIQIDFEHKPHHSMALKFALQNLELLEEGHILAQRMQDRAKLETLAQEDPATLIEEVVASHGGSILLDQLEDTIKGGIVAEDQYKAWWEAAKRKLRGDRRFVLPQRRSEPLVVRSGELDASELLLADLQEASDLKAVARALNQIIIDLESFTCKEGLKEALVALEDRIIAGVRTDLIGTLEVILVRDELYEALQKEAPEKQLEVATLVQQEIQRLGEHLRSLPVATIRKVLKFYPQALAEDWSSIALQQIHGAGTRGVAELARFLTEEGNKDPLIEQMRVGIADRALDQDALVWICRERSNLSKDLFNMELSGAIIHELERDYYDEESRGVNRLRDLVTTDKEMLGDLIEDASYAQARNFAKRLLATPAFDDLTRKSLIARLMRLQPRLEELLVAEVAPSGDELIVSWASLERRKEELDDLINRQMPENVKEIQIARSYGDLRENFEYKAAKEMKAVLERRRMELERDLSRAKGADFKNVDTKAVAIGTKVTLESSKSGEIEYTILGAWDGDVEKNILSYQSATASALIGKAVGEKIEMNGISFTIKVIKAAI